MTAPLLSLQKAVVRRGQKEILKGLSLDLYPGELVGLLGPNGSGKTTAARSLLGLVPLSSGSALIGGDPVASLSATARARRVAYLPQSRPVAWPIAVHEAIALGRFAYGGQTGRLNPIDQAAVDEAVEACDLKGLLNRDITTLSGGEAARVHVARALAAKAPALIADEPTAALDPLHQWTIMQVLARQAAQGSGILTVVHDVTLAVQFCTRVVVIKDGECLASGPPAEVLTPDLLAKAYGIDARWTCDADGSALVVHGPAVQGL